MPKIPVENQNEEEKEENQFAKKEITHEEKDKTLEKLYQDKRFQIIHRPPKISLSNLLTAILTSFILGIILAFYLLSKNLIKIPFLKF